MSPATRERLSVDDAADKVKERVGHDRSRNPRD